MHTFERSHLLLTSTFQITQNLLFVGIFTGNFMIWWIYSKSTAFHHHPIHIFSMVTLWTEDHSQSNAYLLYLVSNYFTQIISSYRVEIMKAITWTRCTASLVRYLHFRIILLKSDTLFKKLGEVVAKYTNTMSSMFTQVYNWYLW